MVVIISNFYCTTFTKPSGKLPEHLRDVDGDGGGAEVHDEGEDEVLGDEREVEAGGRQELLHDEDEEDDERQEERDP